MSLEETVYGRVGKGIYSSNLKLHMPLFQLSEGTV